MRSQARISFPPTLLTRIKQGTRRQGCPEPLTLFWRMRGQPAVSDGSVMQPFEARRRLEGSLTHFVAAGGNETRPRRATDGRGMRRHKFDTPPHAQFTANARKKWGGRGGGEARVSCRAFEQHTTKKQRPPSLSTYPTSRPWVVHVRPPRDGQNHCTNQVYPYTQLTPMLRPSSRDPLLNFLTCSEPPSSSPHGSPFSRAPSREQ